MDISHRIWLPHCAFGRRRWHRLFNGEVVERRQCRNYNDRQHACNTRNYSLHVSFLVGTLCVCRRVSFLLVSTRARHQSLLQYDLGANGRLLRLPPATFVLIPSARAWAIRACARGRHRVTGRLRGCLPLRRLIVDIYEIAAGLENRLRVSAIMFPTNSSCSSIICVKASD